MDLEFLNMKQVSEMLDVSRYTIYTYVKLRDFPCIHIGHKCLFPKKEVEQWIAENSIRGNLAIARAKLREEAEQEQE